MATPLTISILITYFNERALLTECLESLRTQCSNLHEVLIYDDASNHPPEPFIPSGLPVRIIRGAKNMGPGRGRNALLEEASGEFVHFHDSDDWFHPDWSTVVTERLSNEATDVLFTDVTSSSSGMPNYAHPFMGFDKLYPSADLTAWAIEHALLIPSATIRRENVMSIGGFRAGLWQSEDKDFYIRLAASGVRWMADPRPLVCIRNRSDSRSKREDEVWLDGLKCLEFAREELSTRYHQDIANAAAKCATKLIRLDQRIAARRALALADALGGARYEWRNNAFRHLAKSLGAEYAEVISLKWQKLKAMLAQSDSSAS
jgi:glycosyltransferase involved in cell wall biosynthesis